MSKDNVVAFPGTPAPEPEPEQEEQIVIPEGTQAAIDNPGWMAATLYINEVGRQIFGVMALVDAVPDPEGFFQKLNGKAGDKSGLYVTINSMRTPGLEAALVVPFDRESLAEIRSVLQDVAVQLRIAEEQRAKSKLLVPEKRLIVPGQE